MYMYSYNSIYNKYRDALVLSKSNSNKRLFKIFDKDSYEENVFLSHFEKILYHLDTNRYLLYYTHLGDARINLYLDNEYFDLTIKYNFADIDINTVIRFSDNMFTHIKYFEKVDNLQQLKDVSNKLSELIVYIRNDNFYIDLLDTMNDDFYVYRVQNFMCFNSPTCDQFNVSALKSNSIIYVHKFMSTSFKTNLAMKILSLLIALL